MGITYSDGVITVTGGTQDDPYTMADLEASGTTSSYVSAGGYGGNKYTVTAADLVIGSTLADTYFDITASIIEMNAGQYLTVYTTALRGGNMGATFGQQASGSGTVPFIDEKTRKARVESIRKLYIERLSVLNNTTGAWMPPGASPKIVAVSADDGVTDGPYNP